MAVRIERDGRVLTVIQSRPEVRNAVDWEHADALQDAFLSFDTDEAADVAVLCGEGDVFCAGVDLKSLAARVSQRPRTERPTDLWNFQKMAVPSRADRWGHRGCS